MTWSLINIRSNFVYQTTSIENNEVKSPLKYKAYPFKGDYIGTITIPILNKTFPIYEGTSNGELKKGVGHFTGSVLPGIKDNSVLSAHRQNQFKEIGKLKIGDQIIINIGVEEYIYEVIGTKVVKSNDKTVIVSTEEAILTLTTCYPFNYILAVTERYIVSSRLIN